MGILPWEFFPWVDFPGYWSACVKVMQWATGGCTVN